MIGHEVYFEHSAKSTVVYGASCTRRLEMLRVSNNDKYIALDQQTCEGIHEGTLSPG